MAPHDLRSRAGRDSVLAVNGQKTRAERSGARALGVIASAAVATGLTLGAYSASANDGGDAAATAVITVGSLRLTAQDVERRLARVPEFQLRTYGKTPQEIKKNFVERVLVPELLFAEAARQRPGIETAVAMHRREALRFALERDIAEKLATHEPISDEAIQAYYDQHRSEFVTPPRIRIWRILLADETRAKQLQQELAAKGTVAAWTAAVREMSIDKATAMRQGDLGFVHPSGDTDVPRVRVDSALYRAAEGLKDGEIAAEVVPEGEHWALIWRRGSLPEQKRTLADERDAIRKLLDHQRSEAARKKLVETLRKERVRDVDEKLLENVETPAFR